MDLGWTASRGLRVGLWILAVGFAFLAVATAQPPTEAGKDNETVKPPWEWTLEERLNARFDPQKIRERMRNRGHNHHLVDAELPDTYEVLSGGEHPHLFLPNRVFDWMIDQAFAVDQESRAASRESMAEAYQGELEIDAAFWRDLSIILSPYLVTKADYEALEKKYLAASEDPGESARLKLEMRQATPTRCRARFRAMEEARDFFGRTEFDRFLYETSARDLWEAGEWLPEKRQSWAHIERGCPSGS